MNTRGYAHIVAAATIGLIAALLVGVTVYWETNRETVVVNADEGSTTMLVVTNATNSANKNVDNTNAVVVSKEGTEAATEEESVAGEGGDHIAYLSEGVIHSIDLSNDTDVVLVESVNPIIDWDATSDGNTFVYTTEVGEFSDLRVFRPSTNEERVLASDAATRYADVKITHDGGRIAYLKKSQDDEGYFTIQAVYTRVLEGSDDALLLETTRTPDDIRELFTAEICGMAPTTNMFLLEKWTPQGDHLVYRGEAGNYECSGPYYGGIKSVALNGTGDFLADSLPEPGTFEIAGETREWQPQFIAWTFGSEINGEYYLGQGYGPPIPLKRNVLVDDGDIRRVFHEGDYLSENIEIDSVQGNLSRLIGPVDYADDVLIWSERTHYSGSLWAELGSTTRLMKDDGGVISTLADDETYSYVYGWFLSDGRIVVRRHESNIVTNESDFTYRENSDAFDLLMLNADGTGATVLSSDHSFTGGILYR